MTNASKASPVFIPLAKKHYERYEAGEKDTEYRPHGPRWNKSTCYRDRRVILSCGYGTKRRMTAIIEYIEEVEPTKVFVSIYGEGVRCLAIKLREIKPL